MLENCFYCETYSPEGYCTVGESDRSFGKAIPVSESLVGERKKQIERCCRFLSAYREINEDIVRLESACIDRGKLNRYTASLWKRWGGKLTGRVGTQEKRLASAITADGVKLNLRAFEEWCDRVVVLDDRSGACSRLIVDRIRRYALSAGYDVVSCQCPLNLSGAPEHLIVPELKLGVFTSCPYHRASFENGRRVFTGRFFSPQIREIKQRRDFSFKARDSMMKEALASLEKTAELDGKIKLSAVKANQT